MEVLQQQAQVIDVDCQDEQDYESEANVQFPQDYPTEELCSVFDRLSSHAQYQ